MTDQQEPDSYTIIKAVEWLRETARDTDLINEFESIADLLEAAEKRFSHEKIRADKNYSRLIKAATERDQALASVGAVIEKAASVVPKEHMLTGHMIRSIADIQNAIRSLNPDATAALNEMLADAWDEGQDTYREWPLEKNPYRKDAT